MVNNRESWRHLEKYLPIRAAYALGHSIGVLSGVKLKESKSLIRLARKILKGDPHILRPPFVYADEEYYQLSLETGRFKAKCIDNGVSITDIIKHTKSKAHIDYATSRWDGSSQKKAANVIGLKSNAGIDDVIIASVKTKKWPSWFPSESHSKKKWTRGAVVRFSKLKRRYGKSIVNKIRMTPKESWELSKTKFGEIRVMNVCRDFSVLCHRISSIFEKVVRERQILEFSEMDEDSYNKAVVAVEFLDWRVITSPEKMIRCYWRVPNWANCLKCHRTTSDETHTMSSIDIPVDIV